MKLSQRVGMIKPSPTLAVTAKAKALKARGVDVIGFGAGEPDFDTPVHIKDAAKKALDEGFTKYTPGSGADDLKQAIVEKFQRDNGLKYEPGQVIVSCGAKHSLYNLFQAILDPGDEVVIIAPYWVSYPDMALLAGAKPVLVQTSAKKGFRPDPKDLEKALSPKTKLVVLNSPSNPAGAGIPGEQLKEIASVLEPGDFWIVSDEIYEKIVYDGFQHISIASLGEKLFQKTIVVNGLSKSYSMTGWRIGYAAGDKDVVKAMSNIQDQSTSNPTSFAQKGAVAALNGGEDDLRKMVKEFGARRDWIVKALEEIPGVRCSNPEGAFYVFPDISVYLGKSFQGKKINN